MRLSVTFILLRPQAELRVEGFMSEQSMSMKKKAAASASGGASAEAMQYEKQIADLKAEAKSRFATMKRQLEEESRMKSQVRQASFVWVAVFGTLDKVAQGAQAVLVLSRLCGIFLCIHCHRHHCRHHHRHLRHCRRGWCVRG